mmetsp:Transcript_118242/g.335346  ORF Transcript_118242/g.335346 Transcript_118242/m.335346 type:complete len:217 (-) Transcript_118242:370-1020(-)|eukprot:CAMPEP_0179294378 /NCGR_PEP_ID=MMETSP0797-20121207/43868_1 /TAXON_ID=47934 /ORGANISM="Dinophysis acuminata, Strain DAEP01" /LENGTH=216 /DNA_ID=CAMNT_0021003575 /DNA_START=61 /DNA_END=711 /DNA_ORIENTATION=-
MSPQPAMVAARPLPEPGAQPTLYSVLGVGEDARPDEVVKTYKRRILTEHPDKGGDAAKFDELCKAYKILADKGKREAYDEELMKARDHADLVEGCRPDGGLTKQAQGPMRAKTEPTAGSKNQKNKHCSQPGKPEHCAQEWKGCGSGGAFLKMLTDNITAEEKTDRLLGKYAELPRGKEKKREWVRTLAGHEKKDLKAAAKKREEAERAKWDKWLGK